MNSPHQPEGAAACGMCLEVTKVDNMPFLTSDLTECVCLPMSVWM